MNIHPRAGLAYVLLVLGVVCLAGQPRQALAYNAFDADQSPCYSYKGLSSTASTITVNLKTTAGVTSTITIPNQNPPSILQGMDFIQGMNCGYDTNTSGTYTFWNGIRVAYTNPRFNLSFISSSGSAVPFAGAPFNFTKDSADPSPYWEESLDGWDYRGISDLGYSMTTEGAAINAIAQTGTIKIRAANLDTGSYNQSATVSVPATNCVSLGGTGPRKIVFMRGLTSGLSVSDFIVLANNVINKGFKTIEPLKTYANQFSFYVDLKNYDETSYQRVQLPTGSLFFTPASTQTLMSQNSCASMAGAADQYFFYAGAASAFERGTSINKGKFSGFNLSESNDPLVTIHEMGHAFAGLQDEYAVSESTYAPSGALAPAENCSTKPARDYRDLNTNTWYGAKSIVGCGYTGSGPLPLIDSTYYRPSGSSIMNLVGSYGNDNRFNVVSCGYVIAAIKGQALTPANAASNWPQCLTLAKSNLVASDGIPATTAKPIASNFTPASNGSGGLIQGSGFTPTGNEIMLTPKTTTASALTAPLEANTFSLFDWIKKFFTDFTPTVHGQTTAATYQIDDIPSSDGTTLNFTVPTSVPDGTYTISVSALNSPWTATSYTIVVSGNGAGDPTTSSGSTGGGSSGTSGGTVSTDSTVPTYTCPAGYMLQSSNTCYKASTAATLSYYCPNGGTYIYGILNGVTGHYCNTGYSMYTATSYNTCPSGATLSGTQCSYPTISATKTCTTGYVLSGSSCILPSAVVYKCPTGYTLDSSKACYKVPVLNYDSTGVVITGYSCPSGSSLNNDNTKCVYNAGPIISCTTGYTLQANNTCTISTSAPTTVQTPLLSVSAPVKGAVYLKWTKVDDGSGSYTIQRAVGTMYPPLTEVLPGTTSYIDTAVAPSTSYSYRIKYTTASGVSKTSALVSVTTLARPATPVVKIASTTSDKIIIALSDADTTSITGYGLRQTTQGGKSIFDRALVTTYTIESLSPLTKYCFAAVAYANAARSATSSTVCATTLKAPVVSLQQTTTVTTSVTAPIVAPVVTSITSTSSVIDQSVLSAPTTTSTIPATITYTCDSGATLSNNQCTSTVLSTTDGVLSNRTYTCPTGYTKINASLCKDKTTLATTTTTAVYTCGSTRTLNPIDKKCYTTTQVTVPAVQNYSCLTGYTLNSTNNTCALIVSNAFSTSTTTATAFDAFVSFFRNMFR